MSRKYVVAAFYILITISPTFAQKRSGDSLRVKKSIEVNAALAGGRENNIFRSTNHYFDRSLAAYLPKDSLIKSDQFYDANLDLDYVLNFKKSALIFSTDNWYRGYLLNSNLNQLKSRFKSEYNYNFSKNTFAGIQYQATYNNKIAVSTTGEEITRSFKYFENSGVVFIEHKFNRKNQISLEYAFGHKKYLKEQLNYSLTNDESEISLLYKRRINKHILYASLSRANRKYLEYQAYDRNGKLFGQNPLRNFKYTDIGIKFRYYYSKTLIIMPAIDYSIRTDMFEGYYSYKKIAVGSKIKYRHRRLEASADIDYKQILYDNKQAPSATNSNQLKYKYIYTSFDVSYLLNDKINAYFKLESASRDSNTELEYYKTLRPYNWYEILLGLEYNISI
ncbi:MAG TPA: hypothetical protein VE912_20895 [Bacteroidales bacterium]|nr:hypothetical protein [Bacteroidales bacterium]